VRIVIGTRGLETFFGAGNSIPCVPGHRRSDWREAPECQLAFENDWRCNLMTKRAWSKCIASGQSVY